MDNLLEAVELTKTYGDVIALDKVSIGVSEGITGLLGANGAGKSTLIRVFLGLTEPTSGKVFLLGKDITNSTLSYNVGYMPEHDCLPLSTSPAEFITHMGYVGGLPWKIAKSRAADTLRHVGLEEERYRPIKDYSLGMRQRVKLAQALVHDPKLIILDEPTAGLDPDGRLKMLNLLTDTYNQFGINILITSHLLIDIEKICDKVVLISEGRVSLKDYVTTLTEESENIELRLLDRVDELIQALERRNLKPKMLDAFSLIVPNVLGDSGYDAIRDSLVESSASIVRMAPVKHSLQEIFKE